MDALAVTLGLLVATSAIFLAYLILDFRRRLSMFRRCKREADAPSGRLLSGLEAFFDVQNRLTGYNDANAAFIRSVGEPIDEKLLLKALIRISQRHPMLRMTIKRGGKTVRGLSYS